MKVKTIERNKQMQQDRDAGMSVKEIAEKYGVSQGRASELTAKVPASEVDESTAGVKNTGPNGNCGEI